MENEVVEDEVTQPTAATETTEAPASTDDCQQARPTHEAIAKLAYERWEEAGWPEGSAVSDWLTAEAILMQECDQANAEV